MATHRPSLASVASILNSKSLQQFLAILQILEEFVFQFGNVSVRLCGTSAEEATATRSGGLIHEYSSKYGPRVDGSLGDVTAEFSGK
jgi:hypothetical protein